MSDVMELLRKVPEMKKLIQMSEVAVATYLRARRPDLDAGEVEAILVATRRRAEAGTPAEAMAHASQANHVHRQMFIAAAWLLGASQTQLARLFDIRQQTIHRHITIELPLANRQDMRLVTRSPIPSWQLEGYRENFFAMTDENPRVFSGLAPIEIARILMELPVTTQPDDADDEPAYTQSET